MVIFNIRLLRLQSEEWIREAVIVGVPGPGIGRDDVTLG